MKDAVITVRVPAATRQRLEQLARREGRSLSQQVERLIERAIDLEVGQVTTTPRQARPLAGTLALARVPTLADFREVRGALSASLGAHGSRHDQRRR
ncbi:MAG TPA: ribbon-helix-helix protein, CopG family [Polyangia bacterium]|jgi:hypothetical protein